MTNVWATINEVLFSINPSTDNFTDHGVRIIVLLLLVFIVVKVLKKIMEGGAFRWVFIVTLVVGLGAYFINQSGEQEVDASRLVTRNDTVYEVNSNTPFTGVSFRYAFANGPPIERVTFREGKVGVRENLKNGLREGLFERYHENGTLVYRANYKEGNLDGLREEYRENGQLRERANYKDGAQDGSREQFHENGQLRARVNFNMRGERDGTQEIYREDGTLESRTTYRNDEFNGLWERYRENGRTLQNTGNYTNGERTGIFESYYGSGGVTRTRYRFGNIAGTCIGADCTDF